MEDPNVSAEFAGTCRGCGGNVNVLIEDEEHTYQCENNKCEYSEGEINDAEPEWVD